MRRFWSIFGYPSSSIIQLSEHHFDTTLIVILRLERDKGMGLVSFSRVISRQQRDCQIWFLIVFIHSVERITFDSTLRHVVPVVSSNIEFKKIEERFNLKLERDRLKYFYIIIVDVIKIKYCKYKQNVTQKGFNIRSILLFVKCFKNGSVCYCFQQPYHKLLTRFQFSSCFIVGEFISYRFCF